VTRLGKLLCCALLATTPPLLASCGSSGAPGPGGAHDSITVYSGQHEQTTALLVSAFERESGIKVHVRSADEASLGNQVLQEQGNSPADVFYAENTPVLELLHEHGLLAPTDAATLAAIPSRYDSARGDWVGVSARVSVLVYDKSKVAGAKLPTSVLELASPQWAGKVGFAPSETDFQPLLRAIEVLDGRATAERWLKALKAGATVYPDNETVVTQVNNGQSAIGPINQYYWFRLRAEQGAAGTHSALRYFKAGDPGDLVDVSGAAVLKSSAHQTSAQRFLAFLVSARGQQVLAHSHSFEYPLRQGVAPAAGLRPLSQIEPNSLTPAELGDGRAPLELEQRLGLL
jgi:iron(III) transport system substrate-binding protein